MKSSEKFSFIGLSKNAIPDGAGTSASEPRTITLGGTVKVSDLEKKEESIRNAIKQTIFLKTKEFVRIQDASMLIERITEGSTIAENVYKISLQII